VSAPLVEVLMSTHNGEKYVAQQVDSILRQSHRNLRLLVRDDGSTDGTLDQLARIEDPRVLVRQGERLGLPQAFFQLLDESGDDADYWSLADQDDVWLPDKVGRAVQMLAPYDGPAMCCTRVQVTDDNLRPLYRHELPQRGPSFANALVQNIALGCTTVINRAARELLLHRWPDDCVMHDAWIYLVVAGTGTVVYDDEVQVLYRQHGGNTVGMGAGPAARLAGRVRRQMTAGGPGKHSRQDRELLRLHAHDLRPESLAQLKDLLVAQQALSRRVAYALAGPAHRQTRGSDVVLKALLVLGRV